MFPNAGVCLGDFWDFIGKYNFIKDVGKLMSYIGNVHPNVGKYHGKILGLVWDFFVPNILISCWEFNIKSWECLFQYCKISWENVGPSLGFSPTPKCCCWFYFGNLTPYYRSLSRNTESQIRNCWELFGILRALNITISFNENKVGILEWFIPILETLGPILNCIAVNISNV